MRVALFTSLMLAVGASAAYASDTPDRTVQSTWSGHFRTLEVTSPWPMYSVKLTLCGGTTASYQLSGVRTWRTTQRAIVTIYKVRGSELSASGYNPAAADACKQNKIMAKYFATAPNRIGFVLHIAKYLAIAACALLAAAFFLAVKLSQQK